MADIYSDLVTKDLQSLLEEEHFTQDEVSAIANKRRSFELRLRNTATKDEFLQYIQYEEALLALRWSRHCQLSKEEKKKKSKRRKYRSRIIRPILTLFERMFKRYWDDIRLWLQYFDFCSRVNTKPPLLKRAIQLHSMNEQLWIFLASIEKQIDVARSLLQRGVRLIGSKRLWQEYFKLELRQFCATKQESLLSSSTQIQIDDNPLLSGETLRVVFDSATEAFSDDFNFQKSFISNIRGMKGLDDLRDHMYDSCKRNFSNSEKCWTLLACRKVEDLLSSEDIPCLNTSLNALEYAVAIFEEAIEEVPTQSIWVEYVQFWDERASELGNGETEQRMHCRYVESMLTICSRAHGRGLASPTLYQKWISLLLQSGNTEQAIQVVTEGTESFPSELILWQLYIELTVKQSVVYQQDVSEKLQDIFNMGSKRVAPSDKWDLLGTYIKALIALGVPFDQVLMLFKTFYKDKGFAKNDKAVMLATNMLIFVAVKSIETARSIYETVLSYPPVSEEFYLQCISIESTCGDSSSKVHRLYQRALSDFGETSTSLWIDYVNWKDVEKVSDIYNQASRSLKEPFLSEFMRLYEELK